jgi:hypothetical protein
MVDSVVQVVEYLISRVQSSVLLGRRKKGREGRKETK